MRNYIDLRSDSVTRPTDAMRVAMYLAEVGDDGRSGRDGRGEDPTVNELEDLAAEILKKESALLVSSGTMGNLIAMMLFCDKGDHVITGRNSHINRIEKGVFCKELLGLKALTVDDEEGYLPSAEVERQILDHSAKVITLENTHNYSGGLAIHPENTRKLGKLAREYSVPLHLDGARLFNAASALGVDVGNLVNDVDTVMFSLSKSLSAPVGAILAGTTDLIGKAREKRDLLGGQMRQAGIIAAAGIVALKDFRNRIIIDHEHTSILAGKLNEIPGISIDEERVQTNILKVDVSGLGLSSSEFKEQARRERLLVSTVSNTHVRFVLHKDISIHDIDVSVDIVKRILEPFSGGAQRSN